jgi:hypothetical protein
MIWGGKSADKSVCAAVVGQALAGRQSGRSSRQLRAWQVGWGGVGRRCPARSTYIGAGPWSRPVWHLSWQPQPPSVSMSSQDMIDRGLRPRRSRVSRVPPQVTTPMVAAVLAPTPKLLVLSVTRHVTHAHRQSRVGRLAYGVANFCALPVRAEGRHWAASHWCLP